MRACGVEADPESRGTVSFAYPILPDVDIPLFAALLPVLSELLGVRRGGVEGARIAPWWSIGLVAVGSVPSFLRRGVRSCSASGEI